MPISCWLRVSLSNSAGQTQHTLIAHRPVLGCRGKHTLPIEAPHNVLCMRFNPISMQGLVADFQQSKYLLVRWKQKLITLNI